MIYDLGARIQAADFTDRVASAKILGDLQHEFTNAVSASCILCLLHAHAGSEEREVFPSMQSLDPTLIRQLLDDHTEISLRLGSISKLADELALTDAPERRLEQGVRINRQVNEFFAFYLAHMNKEEVTIVPAMKAHFTDPQLGAMQGAIIAAMPPERVAGYLRWMLPSMNVVELTEFLSGVKRGAPPPMLQAIDAIGSANVNPARWTIVRQQLGL
jgi:hemerythrin superfamily protein